MLHISNLSLTAVFVFCWLIFFTPANADDQPFGNEQFIKYEQTPEGDLTAEDQSYLKNNQIYTDVMSTAQKGGLHSVINDPGIGNDPAVHKVWVKEYVNLVAAQNIQCMFNASNANAHCELSSYHN